MSRNMDYAICGLIMAMSFITHAITGNDTWLIIGSVFLAACFVIEVEDSP